MIAIAESRLCALGQSGDRWLILIYE